MNFISRPYALLDTKVPREKAYYYIVEKGLVSREKASQNILRLLLVHTDDEHTHTFIISASFGWLLGWA